MTRITQVDAFTQQPFSGNPAAVCVLDSGASAEWMQAVATEMNLSETAFLWPENSAYRLRWFTPSVEVDLCGHATLASAHVLWEQEHLRTELQARFHTRSGLLTAERRGEWIVLDFPAEPPVSDVDPQMLEQALGIGVVTALQNRMDILVEVESAEQVRDVAPDIQALSRIDCRGVIVTAASASDDCDFVSRFFAPAVGVNEDPVTGSAHCFLAPFWAERLDKSTMVGYQASARGGIVKVELRGDRVGIGGRAVTVMDGRILA